jgi:hypothetical protein
LALKGEAVNLTLPPFGTNGSAQAAPITFVARRQDHVLFTAETTIDFDPKVDGEEAGMSVFLTRAQHFDFGIVGLTDGIARDGVRKFVRLLTITPNSTNGGASDPFSQPGILPLPDTPGPIRLRVEASSALNFTFSYQILGSHTLANATWTTVGFGNSTEVSGGFTGVGNTCSHFTERFTNSWF